MQKLINIVALLKAISPTPYCLVETDFVLSLEGHMDLDLGGLWYYIGLGY